MKAAAIARPRAISGLQGAARRRVRAVGRHRLTISSGVAIGAAFTGYLSQQNFDSQWISTQAKDGINATGAGAIFNVTNFGQMLMWHIVLLPMVVVLLVAGHVLLVRLRGVVPPFPSPDDRLLSPDDSAAGTEAASISEEAPAEARS